MTEEIFKVGERVQLHPGTDLWVQGDRYGQIAAITGKIGAGVYHVRMDKSGKIVRFRSENLMKMGE